MSRVFIGVGSNEGDRLAMISRAGQALSAMPEIRLLQMAPILETEPVGGPPQGLFLNTVMEIETTLGPRSLLHTLQTIEKQLGRVPSKAPWGPRPMDLDILLYADACIEEDGLVIPHPRMHERLFVLQPLAELAPHLVHPRLRQPISALLETVAAS